MSLTLFTSAAKTIVHSKDRYVADGLDVIDEKIAATTEFPYSNYQPLMLMDELCRTIAFAQKAEPQDFKDGLLCRPHAVSLIGAKETLPIKQEDATKHLSRGNQTRLQETAAAIIAAFPDDRQVPWKEYYTMCAAQPTVSHLWRDAPHKFNLYDHAYVAAVNAQSARSVRNTPQAVGAYYIGAVSSDAPDADVPIAQQRKDGEINYYFGQDHGSKKWVANHLHMLTRAGGGGEDDAAREKNFNRFSEQAEFYFNVKRFAKDRYTIVFD